MKSYTDTIRTELARTGYIGVDPRHIEGYMRLEHATLDGLSWRQFQREVELCAECVGRDGMANAEANAQSFGL